MATNDPNKPRFGPTCSPAIFARKWLEKYDKNGQRIRDDPNNMERSILEAIELNLEFTREALALQLRDTSFPADDTDSDPPQHQNPFNAPKLSWTFVNLWVKEHKNAVLKRGITLTEAQQAVVDRVNELVAAGRWQSKIPGRWMRELARWGRGG